MCGLSSIAFSTENTLPNRHGFVALAIVVFLILSSSFSLAQAAPVTEPVPNPVRDSAVFFQNVRQHPPLPNYEKEIDQLLARMTLAEKIGQMTQLEIGMVSSGRGQNIEIDVAKLRKAVNQYGVGSILNVNDEALPPGKWHEILRQIQSAAAETRLKIPVLYGIDSIHGANYVQGSTLFPQPIGMAATWNPELALRAAQITADETRAAGIPWTFSPVLDIGRQPLWPRLYETYGEDPLLAQVMGTATVRGYEGIDPSDPRHLASSLKHYVGYSGPTSGRDRTPALIPEVTLREYYLPTFRAAVEAGARTVMVNSSEINGIPGHVNRYLLTDVLRNELKFDGLVVSDWEDIKKLVSIHHVAANEKDATRMAIMAGIDMSMVPSDYSFADLLTQLVKEGAVPMLRIDEAVRRILLVKYQLGLFRNTVPDDSAVQRVGTAGSRAVALQAARESIVLLKNDRNVLPLRSGKRVLLTGPTADTLVSLSNGWTYTWQGARPDLYPRDRPTLRQALATRLGAENLSYVPGVSFEKEIDLPAATAAAVNAGVIVVAAGEPSYTETPGNINDLTLTDPQLRLIEAMVSTGKPVVLVLIEGRPRIMSRVADNVGGVVLALNPSNEGGQAIADVLFGDVNPSGRLPITYPRSPDALLNYDRKAFENNDQSFGLKAFQPQFEFGAGLSYTTYSYSNLHVSPSRVPDNGTVQVQVTVTNTGTRAGKEVVQVYLSDLVASMTPPGKRLVRFAKVPLQPGASETLAFTLTRDDMSFVGPNNKPVVEPGAFEVHVGNLTAPFELLPAARSAAKVPSSAN
jgi:beta-glucosidase